MNGKISFFYLAQNFYLEKHKRLLGVPDEETKVGFLLNGKPYIELGYGVENIFKFFRVDFIHRMSYLDKTQNPDVRKFGVLFSFQFNL